MNKNIIFVLGGPGSGKSTLCNKLCDTLDSYFHISVGQLLRNYSKELTDNAIEVKNILLNGQVVPAEIVIPLLKDSIINCPSNNILIDGFPRNLNQAKLFEEIVCHPSIILYLDVNQSIALDRLRKRVINSSRDDDTEEILLKRLKTNKLVCEPVVKYYIQTRNDDTYITNANENKNDVFAKSLNLFQ